MNKKKEEKENPLHTEYGILSNSVYILGKIKKYCPKLLALMAVGVVTNSLMQYMWSIIGKFVLDIVEQQANSPEKDIAPLIKLLIITTAVEIVSMIINTVTDNKRWYNAIGVRMHVITERAEKTLSMNYQTLERPDILDMESKAEEATGGNNNGVEGLIHSVYSLGVQLFVMVTTFSVVAALDWRLVLIIAALSVVQFLFFRYTVKKDRKEVWTGSLPYGAGYITWSAQLRTSTTQRT